MSGENVIGIVVLVGLPVLALAVRALTKRFLEGDAHDESPREKVGAPD